MTDVTVIVATYQRPDALALALRSVQLQTFDRWRVLVVGDCCDGRTSEAMEAFRDDPRIAFVNLPWRCGGQPLPNSAGMAVAQTEYVAFLNHDDVWMPEHLALGIDRLRNTGCDFFMGRAAFAMEYKAATTPTEPIFGYVSLTDRSLREAFWRNYLCVEPASAWIIHRSLAERVGPWRRADEVHRLPIVDWVLRAWRAGGRLVQHQHITCLKIETHWQRDRKGKYENPAEGQAWCVDMIARGAAQNLASGFAGLPGSPGTPIPAQFLNAPVSDERAKALASHLLTPEMADLYFRSGLDTFDWLCGEVGIPRGERLRRTFRNRTGEDPPVAPPLAEVVAYVAEALERMSAWSGA